MYECNQVEHIWSIWHKYLIWIWLLTDLFASTLPEPIFEVHVWRVTALQFHPALKRWRIKNIELLMDPATIYKIKNMEWLTQMSKGNNMKKQKTILIIYMYIYNLVDFKWFNISPFAKHYVAEFWTMHMMTEFSFRGHQHLRPHRSLLHVWCLTKLFQQKKNPAIDTQLFSCHLANSLITT